MSETANAAGAALPVEAATGPPVSGAQQTALTLLELATAEANLDRAKAKVAKARQAAEDLKATADETLAGAQDAAEEAMVAATEALGTDDEDQVRQVARALAAELERHQAELAKLTGGAGDGGE